MTPLRYRRLGSTGALACAALEENGSLRIDESFDHRIRSPEAIYIAMNTGEIGVWSPDELPVVLAPRNET
jgi:hypothetical protein